MGQQGRLTFTRWKCWIFLCNQKIKFSEFYSKAELNESVSLWSRCPSSIFVNSHWVFQNLLEFLNFHWEWIAESFRSQSEIMRLNNLSKFSTTDPRPSLAVDDWRPSNNDRRTRQRRRRKQRWWVSDDEWWVVEESWIYSHPTRLPSIKFRRLFLMDRAIRDSWWTQQILP